MAAQKSSSHAIKKRSGQLWQLPLFLLSLGLFGYAAYLLMEPGAGPSTEQKIATARLYLVQHRPEAAIEYLNKILASQKMDQADEARVHLLLARALDQGQKKLRIDIPANHERIIEQTRLALSLGVKPDAELYQRLGESFEALGRSSEALANYRQAMALNPEQSVGLQKRIIELQVQRRDAGAAEAQLDTYLKNTDLADAERAWATGQQAQLLIGRGQYIDARALLAQAQKLTLDTQAQGEVNYRLGYVAWKLQEEDQAERYLRIARDQLGVGHPLDAQASYFLGRIFQARRQPEQAQSFYENILVSHPDDPVAIMARLGRGVCRLMLGEDAPGLGDLHDLTNQLLARPKFTEYRQQALEELQAACALLMDRKDYMGAIEVLTYEHQLRPEPDKTFFARLGVAYERRADQLEKTIADARPAEQMRRTQQVKDFRRQAGDAYIAYSRALTLVDDQGYADAMWRGIDLYNRAMDLSRVITSLEVFAAERPDDPLAPDALLRLGRAYQAAGMFDKAIAAFQRNQFRYPQSLAASKSAVPLAQAYIAKGPQFFGRAETVLKGVVEDNPLLTPDANEFKRALFELGQLYYRTGRYEEALSKMQEWTQRYPKEAERGQVAFLMADSYRKSAMLLDGQISRVHSQATTQPMDVAQAQAVRQERLRNAEALYSQAIDLYGHNPPTTDLDKLYQKLSHFYRADCTYDLGEFKAAIRLYDSAAFRYQDDPSALSAYVQIVNAYCALGQFDEAKAANERAKWMLRRMPPTAFEDGSFQMPKPYWDQWLTWTSKSGMWP